jgi:peptidyl-prolyl cis-trans isomerase A (cyclophilin A)
VNLTDAILGLRIMTGTDITDQTVNIGADIKVDNKIGLPERIYILQNTAGIRKIKCNFREALLRFLKCGIVILLLFLPMTLQATVVRLQTVLGVVDIELFDSEAPRTVANFLNYLNVGAYNNSFVHRSVPGFVIQGGGYIWDNAVGVKQVVSASPIANEYSNTRSNLRGTIAMAKLGDNPDSATSQWFINLANNSSNLDNQNGGFTVFGRVTGNGMTVVDAISSLATVNAGGVFTNLPVLSIPASGNIGQAQLVMVTTAAVLEATTKGDLNNDGKIDLADTILALQLVSGIAPEQNYSTKGDADAKIGLPDAIYILQEVAGLR